MLITDAVAFCLNVVLLFVLVLRSIIGDAYVLSDNSDTLKKKMTEFFRRCFRR